MNSTEQKELLWLLFLPREPLRVNLAKKSSKWVAIIATDSQTDLTICGASILRSTL